MAVGLFWNHLIPDDLPLQQRFFLLGNNTGNLAFIRALDNILHPVMCPISSIDDDTFRDRAEITHYVTTDMIWLTDGKTYPHVWEMLRRIGDKPLVPISVGLHVRSGEDHVQLHPDTVALLRSMAERVTLGVRGEYTASVLEKHGVINLAIIGCPSLFDGMQDDFALQKPDFRPDLRAVSNFRTFYGNLSPAEAAFLTFCANHDLPFVEQTQQPLTLENCEGNAAQFAYLNAWQQKQRRTFFHLAEWEKFLASFGFSIGSRFHGNVLAIRSGVPALTLTFDNRMQELTKLMRMPTLPMARFELDRPLSYYYDLADFSEFNRVYPKRLAAFRSFLKRTGLLDAAGMPPT